MVCNECGLFTDMIVTFTAANYRSLDGEETINFVASNRFSGTHDSHAAPIPGSSDRVLRVGVLYGANGAGKSNLFKALAYLATLALAPRSKGQKTGREACLFSADASAPSTFDLQFIASGKLYRYGVLVDDLRIVEERLSEVLGNREKLIFERSLDSSGVVNAPGLAPQSEKALALAKIGGPQNQTFLATVRATLDSADYDPELRNVLRWFDEQLTLISPDTNFLSLAHALEGDSGFAAFAGEFLKAASTGVDRLEVAREPLSEEQLRKIVSDSNYEQIHKDLQTEGNAIIHLGPGRVVSISQAEGGRYQMLTVQTVHDHETGSRVTMDLDDESDGTRRLLDLIPALHRLHRHGGVFVVDEIDRSMHPMLIWKFIEFFLNSCAAVDRQLIVTTHECHLLDLDLLRRDEIWFAEKDGRGATHLYSLADFKVRNDLRIDKHYLQGRFGAVPFLGGINHLHSAEEATTA